MWSYTFCAISKQFLSHIHWENFTLDQFFYTTSGCDGCDKYQIFFSSNLIFLGGFDNSNFTQLILHTSCWSVHFPAVAVPFPTAVCRSTSRFRTEEPQCSMLAAVHCWRSLSPVVISGGHFWWPFPVDLSSGPFQLTFLVVFSHFAKLLKRKPSSLSL